MTTDRLSIRKTDERMRKIDRAKGILAKDPSDDPPASKVVDAALQHLIESHQNMDEGREDYDPRVVQDLCNTSVLKLHYRTSVDQTYR